MDLDLTEHWAASAPRHGTIHALGAKMATSALQEEDPKVFEATDRDSTLALRHGTTDDQGDEKAQTIPQGKGPEARDSGDGGSLWNGAMARLMDWRSKAERPTTDALDVKRFRTTPVKRPRRYRRIGGLSLDEDLV